MRLATLLLVPLLAAACGGSDEEVTLAGGGDPGQRYAASGTVLESPDHGPQLCLGGVAESYPPQCGGPDLVGWDWDDVGGEESASGTTWGEYRVVGTWDGERLTLTEPPGPPVARDARGFDLSTPCPPPPGGWSVVDERKVSAEAQDATLQHARAQPGFAGAWLDQSINPASQAEEPDEMAMNDPAKLVLNVRFTGDVERHEAELRELWGGSLCVSEAQHTIGELERIQQELHDELTPLHSGIDETSGVIDVGVTVAEPGLQAALEERYGPGVVRVTGALDPVG